jgi:O-methyltransferase
MIDILRNATNLIAELLTCKWFLVHYYTRARRRALILSRDPVRYGTVALAIESLIKDDVKGALAECGVYKGDLSRFIHDEIPDRTLYLFDTFDGFDQRDAPGIEDDRFRNTSVERVLRNIGTSDNIVIRKGYFPETADGLEHERFAFVMIDFDRYKPTMAALEFMYPRTNPGGYIFVHDYSSPESNWACSRALDEFLADKPETPIAIPDAWGSALFRKL